MTKRAVMVQDIKRSLMLLLYKIRTIYPVAVPRFHSFMHMLGRKKGMMTISCRIFNDPFFRSSKWCQAVLVATRITKLMGMLRLKTFWMSVNGREMYAHSETEKRGKKC